MTARFAAIADVHGNRWALEAVLEDIARRGVRSIVNLGDNLFGPLDVDGTAELLMRLDMPGVSGNQDRELVEAGSKHSPWLASLPLRRELPGMVMLVRLAQNENALVPILATPLASVTLARPEQWENAWAPRLTRLPGMLRFVSPAQAS